MPIWHLIVAATDRVRVEDIAPTGSDQTCHDFVGRYKQATV